MRLQDGGHVYALGCFVMAMDNLMNAVASVESNKQNLHLNHWNISALIFTVQIHTWQCKDANRCKLADDAN